MNVGLRERTLPEWLEFLEALHPAKIVMGLERVEAVKSVLGLAPTCVIVTVAGTNGKGSTCAMLESILHSAGYRVGCYTSPHLLRFSERIRVNAECASDAALCNAFATVELARQQISVDFALTYFEFTTLAAMVLFLEAKLDVVILECGLGGRLDAVNAFDSDCAVLTNIDMDHQDYLGDTREKIGFEKAHILRFGKPAVCADPMPPESVIDYAKQIGAQLYVAGKDFGFRGDKQQWDYWGPGGKRHSMAYPALRGANQQLNASAVLATLDALHEKLPVSMQDVRQGFAQVSLPGRFQVLPGRPTVVLDVAHNPHAASVLAANLSNMGFHAYTYAVFGMLHDKDIAGVVRALKTSVDFWMIAPLPGPRGASAGQIADILATERAGGEIFVFDSIASAYLEASRRAQESDRIVIFGSFLTVADVLQTRTQKSH